MRQNKVCCARSACGPNSVARQLQALLVRFGEVQITAYGPATKHKRHERTKGVSQGVSQGMTCLPQRHRQAMCSLGYPLRAKVFYTRAADVRRRFAIACTYQQFRGLHAQL